MNNLIKNTVLLGAGYLIGKSMKSKNPSIGAVGKGKYFIDYMRDGVEKTEVFDKMPKGAYKGQTGVLYLTRWTDSGTTLIPILDIKTNMPVTRKVK
jgi:hypothetical protein